MERFRAKLIFLILGLTSGAMLASGIALAWLFLTKPWRLPEESIVAVEKEGAVDAPLRLDIDASKILRPISPFIYGSNLTAKTEYEMDVADFARDTGITIFRYPGTQSEGYRWKTGKFDFNKRFDAAPLGKIEKAVKFCELAGARLLLQVNIESGTPREAAEWVDHMNNQLKVRVDYWEIGNEVYGEWERNFMSATEFGKIVREYAVAMKAVDPTIKLGVNFGGPNYPDFDEELIREAGDVIDFVAYHWYPNHISASRPSRDRVRPLPEEIMANSLNVKHMIDRIGVFVAKHRPERKGKIDVAFLEWDGSWDAPASDLSNKAQAMMWSLANGIFYADMLGQFATHGVNLALNYNFQEVMFGLIRGWDQEAGWGGDRWDGETVRPKGLAMKLFARYFGDQLVESRLSGSPVYVKQRDMRADSYTGEVPYVSAYASIFSKQSKMAVVLINRHAKKDFQVDVRLAGVSVEPQGVLRVLNGPGLEAQNDGSPRSVDIREVRVAGVGAQFDYKIPAHSVSLFEIILKDEPKA